MKNYKANHGEVVIRSVTFIPADAKKHNPVGEFVIIANSEITGNHHRIKVSPNVKFFEKNGVLYMENPLPVEVDCVIKERHDTEYLPPGMWEVNRKRKEYDYITQGKRNVTD